MSPQEAMELQEQERATANDENRASNASGLRHEIMKNKGRGFWFKLRAQLNSYNNRESVRFTTMAVYDSPSETDLNCQKMNRALLNTLKSMKNLYSIKD